MLRCRKQPTPNNIFDRSALSPSKFSAVDAALKDLKLLSRRLHKALSLQQTESQVLERLYYKSKNQHHSALFWRRVCEMRRFAKRLLEFDVTGVVDGLRATFFRDADPSNSKSMSSSWSRYADEKYISSVISSLVSFSSLLQKMHERLGETYKSFSLAMQTGAFIQLTLTLTAIASRIAILVSEIDDTVQRTREVLTRLSAVLMRVKISVLNDFCDLIFIGL
ncbi:hypothetical protein K435DRAFT_259813 [Dendrothele bispora CBS 962.96]|uniref:Nucleolus and neural progenitor protein-like N-terminal domain-containing protein n=1 Tax=Dendrothele bispora (strain CBS 962.96) TaxID=1314807 RepID=A0A4S8MW28_DENBC|nr:hypothetical protein K435DRAFT_259813 [Dendrothele bispora CBS 962.96]